MLHLPVSRRRTLLPASCSLTAESQTIGCAFEPALSRAKAVLPSRPTQPDPHRSPIAKTSTSAPQDPRRCIAARRTLCVVGSAVTRAPCSRALRQCASASSTRTVIECPVPSCPVLLAGTQFPQRHRAVSHVHLHAMVPDPQAHREAESRAQPVAAWFTSGYANTGITVAC